MKEQKNTKFKKMYNEAHKDKQKRGNDRDKTPEQRANARKRRRAKLRTKMAIYATIAFVSGGAVDHIGHKLLNPAVPGVEYDNTNKETVINTDEIQGEVNITGSKAKQFREEQARLAITEESRNRAEEEIENMKEPEDILQFLKDTTVEYWEECYDEKINDVELGKITTDIYVYKDTAQNGDEIERYSRKSSNSAISSILTAKITTDEKTYQENVALEHGKFRTIYAGYTDVEKAEESKLKEEIASAILEGIEYKAAMEQNELGQTSTTKLNEYKEDFKKELAKYYDANLQKEVFGERTISSQEEELQL